ncbi:MAG TPA: TonB-dependent receptor [Thermoanaerobaculia bacterium]|jgi:outer membrane receptor protein involved in Fe transport|nr:TonB-dependent receptor [Thermoanaerobaculia bacterium]
MMMERRKYCRWLVGAALLLAAPLLLAGPAGAQATATASIRGKVENEQGQPLAGAEINAVGTASGFVKTVTAGSDGGFQLAGLTPGEYLITVSASGMEPRERTVTILVGQNLNFTFVMTPTAVVTESITVVGEVFVDTKTPEAATNVTTQQIENLPQDSRNFLNFAALAPGIRLSTDPLRKTIAGDAQPSEQTNVFIDGVSQKNDVLQGGVAGQDASRGNPFPQNAVQEFRVITQNYSAQYEKASSAIITAVTKSGGNEIKGQAFWFYQPADWVSELPKNFQFGSLTSNDEYERNQPGFSLGGPIIRDKLHYFVSYERDDEDATTAVTIGNAAFFNRFGQYIGNFPSPFKQNLGFAKLSWQPAQNQLVDWSGTYRKEHETRDFGNNTSFESATDLNNWVYGSTLRHQWNSDQALNQLSLSWQDYAWNPTPLNPGLVGRNYEGVVRIGGNTTTQKFDQRRVELRDDYNFGVFNWHGDHSLQAGVNLDFLRYFVNKSQNANPVYNFRNDPANGFTFDQPHEAVFGFGDPTLSIDNREYGIYGQDTWLVNPRLTVTLGLRWDYETDQLDQDYVTPANIVAGLAGKVDSSYFSDGDDRSPFTEAFQPRLGFSYDLRGDSKSVIFGGFGRFYDRNFLNITLDERFRLQYPVYRIQFSPDGRPGTIQWNDAYITPEGLHALIASGRTSPEIFLLNNDTKPPYSNQWNLGIRQTLGTWLGSVSYNSVRGYRGFTWLSATGLCCSALVPGFGNVLISDPEGKRYWYEGVYLTLDRPFQGRWGAHVAWTHGKAEQNGNDAFSLDYPSADAYPRHEVPGSERDRIVANAIVALPWELRFSTSLSFGSGGATNVLDFSQGFDLAARLRTHPFERSIRPEKKWGFADRTVDFRLEKGFTFGGTSVALIGEIFNAFNWATYGCLNNFIPPEGNPSFGEAGCVTNLGRREQVGLRVNF